MIRTILLTLALLLSLSVFSQDIKRTAIWYFGQNAGIDFNTTPPSNTVDGQISPIEGSAIMCDTNGKLLLYTDGLSVYNKNHDTIYNGGGLLGEATSTQTALIAPYPENDSLFYIFTVNAGGAGQGDGFRYNLVNIFSEAGHGKVIEKNILLVDNVTEKLTGVKHSNGRDYWICVHGKNNNFFYLFLVTPTGIVNCPIINQIGKSYENSLNSAGMMKFSPNGSFLTASLWGSMAVEIFRFDCTKGLISNSIRIDNITMPYGIELSHNNIYLMERNKKLLRFSLKPYDKMAIENSLDTIYNSSSSSDIQALQLGLDGKIYMAFNNSAFLGVISNPDSTTPIFIKNGITLTRPSYYGLPNFITSYFHTPEIDFTYQTNCTNNTVQFTEKSTVPITSRRWQVINGNTLIDSSTLPNPSFTFIDTGTYKVQLIINTADTVTKEVLIEPPLIAKRDTVLCNQSSYTISIPDNYRCIMWLEGQDTNRYTVYKTGIFVVSAYNTKGCYVTDTAKVTFSYIGKPNIRKSNDTLYTDSIAATYQWYYNGQPLSNTQNIKITQNGTYKLTATNDKGCSNTYDNFGVSGLGIKDIEQSSFTIYPNPSSGEFIIKTQQDLVYSVSVINALGQVVFFQETISDPQLTVRLNHAGCYLIKITDDLGNTFLNKQIIHH